MKKFIILIFLLLPFLPSTIVKGANNCHLILNKEMLTYHNYDSPLVVNWNLPLNSLELSLFDVKNTNTETFSLHPAIIADAITIYDSAINQRLDSTMSFITDTSSVTLSYIGSISLTNNAVGHLILMKSPSLYPSIYNEELLLYISKNKAITSFVILSESFNGIDDGVNSSTSKIDGYFSYIRPDENNSMLIDKYIPKQILNEYHIKQKKYIAFYCVVFRIDEEGHIQIIPYVG